MATAVASSSSVRPDVSIRWATRAALRRRTAGVVGMRLALDPTLVDQTVDQTGHRRLAAAVGPGEGTDGARPELVDQAHQPGGGSGEVHGVASNLSHQPRTEHDQVVAQLTDALVAHVHQFT
jgi:hypothetical protein